MRNQIIGMIIVFLFIQLSPGYSQNEEDETTTYIQKMRPIDLIDTPTANFLSRKYFQLKLRVYQLGGMLGGLTVGLTNRLMFGVSYGGQNIIGQGKVSWNEAPGVNLRYRLRFEDYRFPAVSLGFNSQGYGSYYSELKRYQIKSKGFYVVFSKNYFVLKDFGIHAGVNYSDENKGAEKDLNFFCGAHLMLDPELSLLWEYDFAINDNDDKSLGSGKGYMNAAVRWYFSRQLVFEFSVKNLLKNNRAIDDEPIPNLNRELKIIYFQNL
jgi:hypothetical protein